ncbi:hypothetical protein ACC848_44880, partial [Rhizobium johnstonii]
HTMTTDPTSAGGLTPTTEDLEALGAANAGKRKKRNIAIGVVACVVIVGGAGDVGAVALSQPAAPPTSKVTPALQLLP